ncbi:HlyD family secretion protein [Flavobacterium sp.]|jgi:multidrug resistance efflux pump|uniref:HlyD family secretion protein n=1 Tax=Flavobacterium sp. TaxID=239 RepID=UPI002FD99253
MLNITKNNLHDKLDLNRFKTIQSLSTRPYFKMFNKLLIGFLIGSILFLLLPWTQNIQGTGYVTTVSPEQRPQTVHTAIAGRIEKWYVAEGQYVKKGDTILFISEIKEDYFDPNLVANTESQMKAKMLSEGSYEEKAKSLANQISAIERERILKLEQARNKIEQSLLKVRSDSMDLEAVKTQLKIAQTQYKRSQELNERGLKAVTDLEEKRLKLQDAEAKIITQQNKFLAAKNELINARVEINRITAEYTDKLSKAQSDRFTALSSQFDTEAQVNKLQNQVTNYKIRNELYYIKAPQNGYVNRALQSGIGETIKEGTPIVSIMPAKYDIAVESFIDPIDLPLIHKGEKVRIWFDGWPTIVFSGWPNASYGTFGGEIVAVENFISTNGKYRVLIAQDPKDKPWPKQLSIGAGAHTFALLDNVPIWYEIWRKLNGFPPDFYTPKAQNETAKK